MATILTTEDGSTPIVTEQATPTRSVDLSDKLTVVNRALMRTGNNPVDVADDGSDEWRVASMAFDDWAEQLYYNATFRFTTQIVTISTRVGDSGFPGMQDVYDKPADCLWISAVCRAEDAAQVMPQLAHGMPDQDTRFPDFEYRLVNDQIHCVAPTGLLMLYVRMPRAGDPWSKGFQSALELYVQADILRGLNEDFTEAERRQARADKAIEFATSRDQNQEPRRVMFRSSVLERRRTRGWGWGSSVR